MSTENEIYILEKSPGGDEVEAPCTLPGETALDVAHELPEQETITFDLLKLKHPPLVLYHNLHWGCSHIMSTMQERENSLALDLWQGKDQCHNFNFSHRDHDWCHLRIDFKL